MALEKCPHMMARCPHKHDACDDSDSQDCHYITNTVGTALSARAALVTMRSKVQNPAAVDDQLMKIDAFLSQNFGLNLEKR